MDLRDDLSLVIGKNNTGKTSLLNVLSVFLTGSQSSFAFADFSLDVQRSLLANLASIKLDAPENYPEISLTVEIRYDEQDNLRNLSKLMVDLSPEGRTIHLRFSYRMLPDQLEQLHADIRQSMGAIQDALNKPDLDDADQKDEIQRFLGKNLKNYMTRSVISFDPTDDSGSLDLTKEIGLVRSVLNLEYVSARRSVENRDNDNGGKSSGRALSRLSSDYFNDHTGGNEASTPFIQLAAQASITDRELTKSYEKVFKDVVAKVKRFGAIAGLAGDLHITSSIQPGGLLRDSTSVKYGEPDTLLPEDHNGLGYLNLIAIIMEIEIRLLRIKAANNDSPSDINLLVIEEPEAHTHPQLQYIFIKKIKELLKEHKVDGRGLQLQTMITTHSSHITAESDFDDIKYFRRVGDRVQARNMTDLKDLYKKETKQYEFLKQYLTLTRAELFFADKAVLIEGDTERILMRAMMRKIDEAEPEHDNPLGSQNISVVEVGAHSQIFDHFIDFAGIKSLIITDIDSAKIEEDNEGKKTIHGCSVDEGSHTTNNALRHYFGLTNSGLDTSGDLEGLRKRKFSDKHLSKKDGKWTISQDDPSLFVAYQTEENNYQARSYEDAFIHLNRGFIKKRIDDFHGLKRVELFDDDSQTAYDLAKNCVAKKTHFALDVIYSESDEKETWQVPSYISEGLRWLRDVDEKA